MNSPQIYLVEPYNAYAPKGRKKHWTEIVEEQALLERIIAEQTAIQEASSRTPMTPAGAGGVIVPPILVVSFNQTDTTFTNGNSAACSGKAKDPTAIQKTATVGGTLGSTPATATADANNKWAVQFKCVVPAGATWNAGTWTWRINVTNANTNITLTDVFICRVNSSNVSQATIGSNSSLAVDFGTTGVKSGTITGLVQTPAVGDYVNIVFVFDKAGMGNESFDITPNQVIDSPITTQ